MSKTTDRTKQWLINGFFTKLKTKPYDKITINDITAQANVSRRTFYRLFNHKEELLDEYCDAIFAEYFAFLRSTFTDQLTFDQMLLNLFTFWYQKRDKVTVLIQNNLFLPLTLKRREQRRADTLKAYRKFDVAWHGEVNQQEAQYIMDFFLGGYWNLISNWLAKETPDDPTVIAKTLGEALQRLNE
ncbi:TetR/AcrR family transcriptional regulator [Fructilactobacillus hinvesii]|uniref:TetR/AcrR family transcriptional regulator n=1 Tax=Fructilactobacillus hinvesii TaxID=2940300 RepID=A0ABY5BQR0_9LACO|nr:TetR/AcrR family transcriptional regulator [Fructilactobacillus hinvesii]USS87443.1 TetR/AcrR family transcriptional regulator [Fructilactobacillus hinvesii]